MKSIIVIFLFLLSVSTNAQFGDENRVSKELPEFLSTTLVVVLDDYETEYNENITKAFNKYWKLNKFIFVNEKNVSEYFKEGYSFFYKSRYESYSPSVGTTIYNRLMIGMARNNFNSLKNLNFFAWVRVTSIYNLNDVNFCVINLVQILHNYLGISQTFHSKSDGFMKKYYNQNCDSIKYKTLLVNKEFLDQREDYNSIESMKKIYPYEVRIVDKEEIKKAVEVQDSSIVYFYIPNYGNRNIFVISANGGKIMYYDTSSDAQMNSCSQCIKDKMFENFVKKVISKNK